LRASSTSTEASAAASQAPIAAASEASASTSQSIPSESMPGAASWLYRSIKQKDNKPIAEVLDAKRKAWYLKLTFWEKVYYAAGLFGASVVVYTRVDWDGSKAALEEAKQKKAAEVKAQRLELIGEYLTGEKSFCADSETLFEGASPAEILALEEEYWALKGGRPKRWTLPTLPAVQEDDPYEGLSPEEIDALVAKQGGS